MTEINRPYDVPLTHAQLSDLLNFRCLCKKIGTMHFEGNAYPAFIEATQELLDNVERLHNDLHLPPRVN